eukprot:TRINITY_DN4247_c0_g1_i1.p1 TRINITY_DN4247_c0_g1~~TRINITY_DN4247_c0_g1_i1.p1  ORF type:complete len:345 (-),score=57.78 TRINITY_DN4247_c0_g1_i1:153-1187(-)
MIQFLETTYTKCNLFLHLKTLRDAEIAVKWLILFSRGNLEQARMFRTDDNSTVAEASLHRNIKLQFQPGCRQFTMHSLRSLLWDLEIAGILGAITAIELDCRNVREIANGGPEASEAPRVVPGEHYGFIYPVENHTPEQIRAAEWWRERMEITPSTWNMLGRCERLRDLHLREVGVSSACSFHELEQITILRVTKLIYNGDMPAILTRLLSCADIFFNPPPNVTHLELHHNKTFSKEALKYFYKSAADDEQQNERGRFLEKLVIHDCTLIFGRPVIELDRLCCADALTTVDLSFSQFGDVKGADKLPNLRLLDLRGNRILRTESERIEAELAEKVAEKKIQLLM